jgi:hypothetical protein
MKIFHVTINNTGATRKISVIAAGWYDALLIVRPHLNEHAACRVTVRPA